MRVSIKRDDVPGFVYLNYIDDDITMFYAPYVVKAIVAVFPLVDIDTQEKLRTMLKNVQEAVTQWEIRDDTDRRDQTYVLEAQV